jgi:hypothetical protein
MRAALRGVAWATAAFFAWPIAAQEPAGLERVTVTGRSAQAIGVADSATEGTIGARQLATRPLLRAAEVLESVPGMTVTQHSGDGKANQYFLRGFNLDHGSDFASFVNGMPVNQVSHAHGQGYSDLNFLIPELVSGVRYRKGSYDAEDGDFGTTGTARIEYVRSLPEPIAEATAGGHGYRRLLGAGSRALGEGLALLGALEGGRADGPWEQPENLHKVNGVLRLTGGTPGDGFDLTAMAYRSHWVATEQVPQRAIDDNEIGRFGTLAPTDGGRTFRYSLSGSWSRSDDAGGTQLAVYAVRYGLNLYSTPSGLQAPQHEQADGRTTWGASLERRRNLALGGRDGELQLGLQWRHDRIPDSGLFLTTGRIREATVREDRITEDAFALYAQARTHWQPWLRTLFGLRLDRLEARTASVDGEFNAANGGRTHGTQASPRLSVVLGPFQATEFYAHWGLGFHSNDARGATSRVNPVDGRPIDRVPVLARTTGAELGLRARPLPRWNTALSLWWTELDSELVFVGDEGVTEPRGASRRHGLEWWNDVAPNDWLSLDADLALSHARFVEPADGGTRVPNAIPVSASLGAAADRGGPWFGGLRLRYIGAYPLEETGTHKSGSLFTANLKLGQRIGRTWRATLEVLNLLDRKGNDIEYWGTSCTRAEGAGCNNGEGLEGRLVHPLEPRTVRVALRASLF